MVRDLATNRGDGIAEGAVRLGVPGSSCGDQWLVGGAVVRPESNQREQAKQCRCGAHNREVGPLALGFDAKLGTDFLALAIRFHRDVLSLDRE